MSSSNNQWLRDFGISMIQRRLPLSYILRTVGELQHHLNDQVQAGCIDADGLGLCPNQLAGQFEDSYRRSHWRSRVPIVIWFVSLLPMCVVISLCYFALIALTLERFQDTSAMNVLEVPANWAFYSGKLITPAITFYLLALIIRGRPTKRSTYVCMTGFVAIFFALLVSDFRFPDPTFGGGLHLHVADNVLLRANPLWQLSQGGIVVTLAAWDALRQKSVRDGLLRQLSTGS